MAKWNIHTRSRTQRKKTHTKLAAKPAISNGDAAAFGSTNDFKFPLIVLVLEQQIDIENKEIL